MDWDVAVAAETAKQVMLATCGWSDFKKPQTPRQAGQNRWKHQEPLSYRQIAKAYQASLNSFKVGLMKQGLSDAEASAFRKQAIQNGSISSVAGAAAAAVERKRQADARRREVEDQRAERKEAQIEDSLPKPTDNSYDKLDALHAGRTSVLPQETMDKPWWQKFQEKVQDAVWHPPSWLSISYQPSTPFSIANYTLGHMVSYNPAARDLLQSIWYQQAQVDLETNYKLTTNPKGAVDVNFSDGTVTFKTSENSSVFIQPGALSFGLSSSTSPTKLPDGKLQKIVNTTTVDFDVLGKNWLSLKVSHASGSETTEVANINGTDVQSATTKLKVTMNVHRWPRVVVAAGTLYLAWAGGLVEGALAAAPALAGTTQALIDKVRGLIPAFGVPQ